MQTGAGPTNWIRKKNIMPMITVRNNFHNTECRQRLRGRELSRRQANRCRRTLCGVTGCLCGGIINQRGPASIVDTQGRQYYARLGYDDKGRWYVRILDD